MKIIFNINIVQIIVFVKFVDFALGHLPSGADGADKER